MSGILRLGNLLSAPFGGYLMCHGAGRIAGHFRFGGRTATAPVLIGLIFVVLGIGFGESGYAMLKTIPDAVLGGLLLFSGIELALSAKLHEHQGGELFLVLLMAAIGVALNPKPVVRPNSIEWVKPIPIEPFLFTGADEGTLTDNAALSPLAVMRPDPACISLPTASERAMLPHQPAWWEMPARENKPA
jgi:Molybdate transporter of MFS superfamily